jgi:endonuclease G
MSVDVEATERLQELMARLVARHGKLEPPPVASAMTADIGVEVPARRKFSAVTLPAVDEPAAQELAWNSFDRLLAGEGLSKKQAVHVTAIVLPEYRPVVDIVQDSFQAPPAPWTKLGEAPFRQRIERAIRAVGRVDLPDHPSLPYAGTGFLVGPNLLMTNRHVAEFFAEGLGTAIRFKAGASSRIDFQQEVGSTASSTVNVERVRMIHPYWDCALLEVDGLPADRPSLVLDGMSPADSHDREATIIGYPMADWRADQELQNSLFGGVFNKKRLQPGLTLGPLLKVSFQNKVEALGHDCSTLGGNSGSALVDIETGHVLALHFSGVQFLANYAVPAWQLARDPHVVAAGVTFGAPAPDQNPEWLTAWNGLGG